MIKILNNKHIWIDHNNQEGKFEVGITSLDAKGNYLPYSILHYNKEDVTIESVLTDRIILSFHHNGVTKAGFIQITNGVDKEVIRYTFLEEFFVEDDINLDIVDCKYRNGELVGKLVCEINGNQVPWEVVNESGIVNYQVTPTKGTRNQEIHIKLDSSVTTSVKGYIEIEIVSNKKRMIFFIKNTEKKKILSIVEKRWGN